MTNAGLALSEEQLPLLLCQPSVGSQQLLFQTLIADLDVALNEVDDWELAEASLDDDQP